MLISHKYGFIIATPVKTGTTTLLGMAQSWTRNGGDIRIIQALTGDPVTKHRMCPPDGCEDYRRYMTVRDPYTRLPSMYEWMRKWPHPSSLHNAIWDAEQRNGERAPGWVAFIRAIAAIREPEEYAHGGVRRKGTRQPYMWTDNQVEHFNYLWGMDVDGSHLPWYREEEPGELPVESLMAAWHQVLTEHEVDEDDLFELKVPHLNRSRDRLASSALGYWNLLGEEERDMAHDWSAEDAEEFGYGVMLGEGDE